MGNECFSFEIGSFECRVINDGIIEIPGGEFLPLACLLVSVGEHKILIDSGRGAGNEPLAGRLVENLQAASVNPGEINKIIITHAHYDHISGIIDSQGRPVFPNARYIIHQKEWDYWIPRLELKPGPDDSIHESCGRKNVLPLKDRFDPVGDEGDIFPGIKYLPVPGHTPGNTMVEISSGSKKILCIGDVMHALSELTRPEILAKFDLVPEEAIHKRIQIMDQIAAANVQVFGCHFPFPGLGYIKKKDGILIWQPI
jgi:glyoxylase-like metal-dependent hydrolase (beta-lactamase superfamily II)